MDYTITKNNLHIVDSYKVPKGDFQFWLDYIRVLHPNSDVWKRKDCSLKNEWAVHNFCYQIGFKRDETKDVDLNYPQRWWVTAAYNIVGVLVWAFVK